MPGPGVGAPAAGRYDLRVDPASLRILAYPDPALRRRAEPVRGFSDSLRAVADRMIQLMHEAEGIGLAAPQVGLPWRLFIAHVPEDDNRSASSTPPTATLRPVVYVNPVLSDPSGELVACEEGCLSLPEIRGDVRRPEIVSITAHGLNGEAFTMRGAGLLARCWQHECDHLDGVLIIDRMSQMSRLKVRSAVRALERAREKQRT